MTKQFATIERIVTVVLTTAILCMAAVLLRREFRSSKTEATPTDFPFNPPTLVANWEPQKARGIMIGEQSAPIQIVEFVDLQCPACRSMHKSLSATRAKFGKQIAVTFIHFPLEGIHPHAVRAAQAAQCAHEQGAVDAFVTAAFKKQDSLGIRSWDSYRRDANIKDSAAFAFCMNKEKSLASVHEGMRIGDDFGIQSTPTTLIDGWKYQGAVSEKELDSAVSSLLREELPPGVVTLLGAHSAAASRTNNAGVPTPIFSTAALAQAPRTKLSALPTAVVGAIDDPEFDLTLVQSAALLDDGRVVTYTPFGRDRQVLVFGPKGRGEKALGRRGSGPNELQGPTSIFKTTKDTILVLDAGNRRLYKATAANGIVDSKEMPTSLVRSTDQLAGVISGKYFVFFASGRVPVPSKAGVLPNSSSTPVNIWSSPDSPTQIAELSDLLVQKVTSPNGVTVRALQFSPRAHVAVWDSLIATAVSDRYQIDLRQTNGHIVASFGVERPRRVVTSQMRNDYIEWRTAFLQNIPKEHRDNASQAERAKRLRSTLLFADSLPAFESIHMTSDGIMWIVDPLAPKDSGWSATAFRLDGTIASRLSASGTAVPIAFNRDRVAVREENQDGFVTLKIYRIVPDRTEGKR